MRHPPRGLQAQGRARARGRRPRGARAARPAEGAARRLGRLQETKRLSKMADDKAVAAAKRETFQWRPNVLGSFSGQGGDGGKAEL